PGCHRRCFRRARVGPEGAVRQAAAVRRLEHQTRQRGRTRVGGPDPCAERQRGGRLSDHDGILRAICDEPGEDLHRLIYADWCDENGLHDRAEFIRVQVALEAMPVPPPRTRPPADWLPRDGHPSLAEMVAARPYWESRQRELALFDSLGRSGLV